MQGYYQYPTIHGEQLVFVCEDDLWWVEAEGGIAQRLTAAPGRCRHPQFSPCGRYLAYSSRDEGPSEVYLLDLEGGQPQRMTFLGAETLVVGFSPKGDWIYYTSNAAQPFARQFALGRVSSQGGPAQTLPYGPAASIDFSGPRRVLGRHTWDTARWKRYRGGTVGQFWVDLQGDDNWRPLRPGGGNLTRPLWLGDRLYFGSDHEGQGNLYSCDPMGEDLVAHTHHQDFYVRRPSGDGQQLVYQCGAEIYRYGQGASQKVPIRLRAAGFARRRKFATGGQYLENYDLHPKGGALVCSVRGQALTFYAHEQAVAHPGARLGVRTRLARWLKNGETIVMVSDEGGEEALEIFTREGQLQSRLSGDWGRALDLQCAPHTPWLALTNHRYELWLIDSQEGTSYCLERNPHDRIAGLAWSPCGNFLAYASPTTRLTSQIKLVDCRTVVPMEIHVLTEGSFRDVAPHFDPKGRYLFFLSLRDFNPVWDNLFFEMSFPQGMRPYLLALRKDLADPFEHDPLPKEEEKPKKKTRKTPAVEPTRIDLEGIAQRISALPVPEGRYGQVRGCGDTIWFTRFPAEGTLEEDHDPYPARGTLVSYDLKTLEAKDQFTKVSNFTTSADGKQLLYRSGSKLRLVTTDKKPESNEDTPGRKSGWIQAQRLRVQVDPQAEWRQMAREAWRLMREHFWDPELRGHDWEAIYQRYLPLLDRVGSRSEWSDWMWELQGELGTSHAYESGGDYAHEPHFPQGRLALDWDWDEKAKGYRVRALYRGDRWNRDHGRSLGPQLEVEDVVTHIQGQPLQAEVAPESLLVHTARQEIALTVRRGSAKPMTLQVRPLRSETALRYREWVEANRRRVHQLSQGQIGYLHVPNMGPAGFSEFHRGYYAEVHRPGLIVDVRYNGGGNVSGLLLEKLSRRIVGWDVPRYGEPVSYPMDAPLGPLVALTNEMAGSDGDIFSHCFKLLKLGPLVGTRTWGGVIGIWPRHKLVDGTQTTQPEFAFWFEDVGWRVENYGTDPDVVVEITPSDYLAGRDPQLDRAIEITLESLASHPGRPQFDRRS